MRVTKNPLMKHKAEVKMYNKLMLINAKHLCRLIYLLMNDRKANFYPKWAKAFVDSYCEYVQYVQEDNDLEVRRRRFDTMLEDAPYITYSRAVNVLDCQAGFAPKELEWIYGIKDARGDFIDNIVLAMLVLHYDFGFGEKRIARIMTAWSQCNLSNAVEWAEKRTGYPIEAPKKDVYDWLMAITKKQRTATLPEQKSAKAGLEAFRAYTDEVIR